MNKILVVDDSASLRGAITFALTKLGKFDIVEAEDGAHALGVIDQHREQGTSTFDLILVDVNMPKMNGFEMIEQVREMPDYRFTPILFLTTENSNESKAKGRKLNATGWITKPFSPENLLGIVERVLHK